MAQTLDLAINAANGTLLQEGSARSGSLPTLTRNDSYTLRVRLRNPLDGGLYEDIDLTGDTLKVGIGDVDGVPSDGQFRLTLSGPVTSSAISYNATTTQVLNAISAIAGNVTVASYGAATQAAWLITAATVNTTLTWGGDSFTLFPTSSVLISTRRAPSANAAGQYVVQLRRTPAVYSDSFTAAATANVVTLGLVQNGGGGLNETYRLSVGPDAVGGSYVLLYGNNPSSALANTSTVGDIFSALASVTGLSSSNISVQGDASGRSFTITFVGSLGNLNVTTALTLDASGIQFAKYYTTTLTMGTSELLELFSESGSDAITPTLEVEVTESGRRRTVYQGEITVQSDLIIDGSAVPAAVAGYYTKTEIDNFRYLANTSTTSASLNFGNVVSHGSSTVTVSLTGAAANDVVLLGLPNSTCAGLVFQAAVSGSDVVKVTALNVTATSVTQSAQTFRLTLIES